MSDNWPASSRKTVPPEKITERAAVNAVRAFFEKRSQVYLEVDQSNDYGKDAYVDLAEAGRLTGLVISIQVKGGLSYRSGTRYHIPYSPSDRNLWVDSSVPVFGIVHDEERSCMHWVNLTYELLDRPSDKHGKVEAKFLLDDSTWPDFYQHAARAAKLGGRSILGLHSKDPTQQHAAISDCFAIGRFDPRALIMLRRSLLYLIPECVEHAIYMLAHCVPFHPDRFWTKENTVFEEVKAEVVGSFNWTASDAAYLLKFVDDDMFHRGSIGEDIYLLLSVGWAPDVHSLFKATFDLALASGDLDIALKSLAVIQYQSGNDAREVVRAVVEQYPIIVNDVYINDLILAVQENGWLDIT